MTIAPPKVFVSYAHEDGSEAEDISRRLRQGGADAFLDKWEIQAGDSLVTKIFQEGLSKASFFVILLSPHSVQSNWVREELNAAFIQYLDKATRVIPVLIAQCDVPQPLRGLRWIDLTRNKEDGVRQLVEVIHGHSAKPPIGPAPDFANSLLQSIGGLSRAASTIGSHIVQITKSGNDATRTFNGDQIKELVPGFSEQMINDAVEELKSFGLVKAVNWMGTAPWRFGYVQPTYAIYRHFAGGDLGYDPDQDVRVAAAAIATRTQIRAADLSKLSGLSIERLNRAVEYLKDYGLVQVSNELGSFPYTFGVVMSTFQTRKFVEAINS